jgi:hypothetical protein
MACWFTPYVTKHQKNLLIFAIDLNSACKIVIVIYAVSDGKGHCVCIMHIAIYTYTYLLNIYEF